jgi:hypothetical protein
MSELVKSTLKRVINTYGITLCADPARLKGLLCDLCPTHRKEIYAVLMVVQEGLLSELKRGGTDRFRVRSLAERLHKATGIDKNLAKWSLRSWIDALELEPAPKRRRTVSRGAETSTRKIGAGKPSTHSAPTIHLLGKARSVASVPQVASVGHTPPVRSNTADSSPAKAGT